MTLRLSRVYYQIKDRIILNDISVLLNPGDHLLIHGASGSGKSTLMHIMAGLLKPTSGQVAFNEIYYDDMTDAQIDQMRGNDFGFVFQKMHLIGHLTVKQNIELANPHGVEQGLLERLGLVPLLNQKSSSLSIGEGQRVALARAVVSNPSIIFADEPTSALDKGNADKAMDMLFMQAKKRKACLVVTSHDERIQSRFCNKLELMMHE